MEIKKSKKLLKALIATSFVGVVATPIMLTSCSKKNKGSFADELIAKGLKFDEEVENQKGKSGEFKFGEFDNDKTKTLVSFVNDDENDVNKNKNLKGFKIVVTLPFEKDAKDAPKCSFDVQSNGKDKEKKDKEYVKVTESEETDKKKVVFNVEVENNIKDLVEPNSDTDKKDEKSGKPIKEVKLNGKNVYALVVIKFTDAKNEKNVAEFNYKITFEEKANK